MREYREEKSCMTCKFGWLGADEPYPCRKCVRVPTEWKPIGNKADRKTENSSEKPNNCEDEPKYEMGMGTLKCDNCSEYGSFKCTKCDGEMYFKRLEPKDEPQTERSE